MVVIFDFDGVINISEYFSIRYAKEFNIPLETISSFFRKEFNRCATGKADMRELLLPYLENWKWNGSLDSLLNYWFSNDIELNQELLTFIDTLKAQKFSVMLASQQEINRKNYIWETLDLKNIFDAFYCTCDLGYLKSDPVFYELILEDLTKHQTIQAPQEVIFFDDSPHFIKAASSTGIVSYQVSNNQEVFVQFKEWSNRIKSYD